MESIKMQNFSNNILYLKSKELFYSNVFLKNITFGTSIIPQLEHNENYT
jgi:hypothetical protein